MVSVLQSILIGGAAISGVVSALTGNYVQAILSGVFIWLVLVVLPPLFAGRDTAAIYS